MAADPHKTRRQKAERRGHVSEWIAAAYLLLKGYRILALRYRTKLGEIDIVARKGDLAVFVEVKARGDARHAIADVMSRMRENVQLI